MQGNKYTFISLDDMTVFHEHRYFVRIRPFKKEFVFPCRTLKDISDCKIGYVTLRREKNVEVITQLCDLHHDLVNRSECRSQMTIDMFRLW